jgi:hypothetical protein
MSPDEGWARAAPLLDAALRHAGRSHGLEDVRAMVADGAAQLWVASSSAAVTVVEQDPGERRLLVWLAGGRLRELADEVLPRMEAWARAQGCRRALIVGRPGWERALQPQGYAPVARLIAKDLQT